MGPLPCMAAGLAVRTVFAQPDAASAWAQDARNSELTERVYRPEACLAAGSHRAWVESLPALGHCHNQPGQA
jgi:hypothetical protein